MNLPRICTIAALAISLAAAAAPSPATAASGCAGDTITIDSTQTNPLKLVRIGC